MVSGPILFRARNLAKIYRMGDPHVVPSGVSRIIVVFADGDRVPGHVYSSNPAIDLAFVKVDGYAKLPAAIQFADSTKVAAGQWAISIGEPFELKQSVSLGVVSGFNRDEAIADRNGTVRLFRGMLQTSAPINPGNSGGPLVDTDGRLIGVNQSTATVQAGAQGIGFAIPADTVRQTVAELERNQEKILNANSIGTGIGYIGVQLHALEDTVRAQLHYPRSAGIGVLVTAVTPGGPASNAGLSPGDVIQTIDGEDVLSVDNVTQIVKSAKIGRNFGPSCWGYTTLY